MVYSYLLIFCRLGTALVVLPAISEGYFSARSRLVVALSMCVIFTPLMMSRLPEMPEHMAVFSLLVLGEIITGLFIGTVARIIITALHVTGMTISYQMGLATAVFFDPGQSNQGAVIGTFLHVFAILLIFTSQLHHLFFWSLHDSYTLFPPGEYFPMGGFASVIGQTVSDSFSIGVQLAAPHIIIGLVMYLGLGVMGRLMPQMQVFFVMVPLQIIIGIGLLVLTIVGTMTWFMQYYENVIANFLVF